MMPKDTAGRSCFPPITDDACVCVRCQPDGHSEYEELKDRLGTILVQRTLTVREQDDYDRCFGTLHTIECRQAACIDELVSKLGYLPEAHAILEKHGLR